MKSEELKNTNPLFQNTAFIEGKYDSCPKIGISYSSPAHATPLLYYCKHWA